ncbi:MAG TPA: ribosome-associated translation inhibitor RaiA [Candidatus Paceibacterota bacterium]|nr:ribosome-associated translation inhibitor RaiA [Candidatus Paceibacterota bacterium]
MNYNLKGTDVHITDEIRSYVEKKLGGLDKFLSDVSAARADVELQYSRDEEKTYRAEVTLHAPEFAESLRAEARGAALHEAIDLVEGELFRELTKRKKKRIHILRRGAGKIKDILRGFGDRS